MRERIAWLDYLRGFACVLVVLLHAAAPYAEQFGNGADRSWWIGNVFSAVTHVCVPLFFMISGYLFFGERRPAARNYLRIVLALLFYSAIGMLYLKLVYGTHLLPLLTNLPLHPVFAHLWFFYALLVVYLFAGLVSTRSVDARTLLVLAVVLFIVVNPRLQDITALYGLPYEGEVAVDGDIAYDMLYALLGSALGRLDYQPSGKVRLLALGVYAAMVALIAYYTLLATSAQGSLDETFVEYNGPLVFIATLAVFIAGKGLAFPPNLAERALVTISRNSLAIYGIHAPVLDGLTKLGLRQTASPLLDIGTMFVATLALSFLIAYGVKQLDRGNWVT